MWTKMHESRYISHDQAKYLYCIIMISFFLFYRIINICSLDNTLNAIIRQIENERKDKRQSIKQYTEKQKLQKKKLET